MKKVSLTKGADIQIRDGKGNDLIIGVRVHGFRIELNGKVIKRIEEA